MTLISPRCRSSLSSSRRCSRRWRRRRHLRGGLRPPHPFANYIQVSSRPVSVVRRLRHHGLGISRRARRQARAADRKVIVPIGDGDFGMNAQEIETSVRENARDGDHLQRCELRSPSNLSEDAARRRAISDRIWGDRLGEARRSIWCPRRHGSTGPKISNGDLKARLASDVTTVIDVRIDPWELAHRTPEFKEFHRF